MAVFALTIFIGAFLLFQVQPLIGKYILPWFGGGPGVWATCMLFFQVLLLGGYAYAHGLSRWLRPRAQALVHIALMLAALAFLPITPSDAWKPAGTDDPSLRILGLLAASIGLPYLVLSATGPLMQHWFSVSHPGKNPYRLYALSNVGSLLALVSYPFLFETQFARKAQAEFWGWGLVLYALAAGGCAWTLWRAVPAESTGNETVPSEPSPAEKTSHPARRWLWLFLPACASALLLAVTNKLCLDVAVIPFLWVAPLAVYLLTFIVAFDSPRWYRRVPFGLALFAALPALVWAMQSGPDWSVIRQVVTYCAGLFVCCMVCHGELYRLRPPAERLTGYFLLIATGGALGGVFVALLAPMIFVDYYELHWSLLACGILFLAAVLAGGREERVGAPPGDTTSWRWLGAMLPFLVLLGMERVAVRFWAEYAWQTKLWLNIWRGLLVLASALVAMALLRNWWARAAGSWSWRSWTAAWLVVGLAAFALSLWIEARKTGTGILYTSRNFYGVLTVYENEPENPDTHHIVLQHGRITHGLQFVDPGQSAWATTYFGQDTGVGAAIRSLPESARQIGIVGLGTGTLAAYGRPGDRIRFYEINPEVVHLASSQFTYLTNCPGKVEVSLGDARLSMEREAPQQFDLLALDAFSSDSIPVHLLTREAFELYNKHVRTNGVLAVHISNHYLDLEPVVLKLARHFGYRVAKIDYEERDDAWWVYSSTWMLLTRDSAFLESPAIKPVAVPPAQGADVRLWTDDFASLFQILQ